MTTAELAIPVRLLRAARLNLEGVRIEHGRVTFQVAPDCVDGDRIRMSAGVRRRLRRLGVAAAKAWAEGQVDPEGPKEFGELFVSPALREAAKRGVSQAALREIAQEEARADASRAEAAFAVMRKSALLRYQGRVLILSTFNEANPQIVAQATREEGTSVISVAETLFSAAEIIWELFTGLLTLLGAKIKRDIPMGKWIGKIADAVKRSEKLTKLMETLMAGGRTLNVKDLFDVLVGLISYGGFNWECLKGCLGDILDIGFWGLLRLILKLEARLIPGIGVALMLADLAIVLVELGNKLYNLFKKPA